MPKIGLGVNVYQACVDRVKWTFDNFEKVYLSFSGGKDSTTMMHIVMREAVKRNKKIGLLFVPIMSMSVLKVVDLSREENPPISGNNWQATRAHW